MQIANLSYSPNCLSFEFFKSISEFRIIKLSLILFFILLIISNILSEQFLIIEIFLLSSNNDPFR
jgi:hypothetical protein